MSRRIINKLLIILLFTVISVGAIACGGDRNSKKDVTPPVLYVGGYTEATVGDEVEIRTCNAVDDFDSNVGVTVKAYFPNGDEIEIVGGKFTATVAGEYKVVYEAVDKAGNKAKKEVLFTVKENTAERPAPTISLGSYIENNLVGEYFVLPTIEVTDSVDETVNTKIKVTAPNGLIEKAEDGKVFLDFSGIYTIDIAATNSAGKTARKSFEILSKNRDKTVQGMDASADKAEYVNSKVYGTFAGMRDLESVNFRSYRTDEGVFFLFDATSDERVSAEEYIEIYFDTTGTSEVPAENSTLRLRAYVGGKMEYAVGGGARSRWTDKDFAGMRYSELPASVVKLGEGSTLESGNQDDNGYIMEVFVPNKFINIQTDKDFYFSLGIMREGDHSWDGWNGLGIFPDPEMPVKYATFTADGLLKNDNRLYLPQGHVDAIKDDEVYTSQSVVTTKVGGLRSLESAQVTLARGMNGLYVYFDCTDDKNVNNGDRVEICLHVGKTEHTLVSTKDFHFWIQASGYLQVVTGSGRAYNELIPLKEYRPEVSVKLHEGTTINENDNVDCGYYGELYIPYSFFQYYSVDMNVSSRTRLYVTFGMWRALTYDGVHDDWGRDETKDWDGWNAVNYPSGFCDPLYPDTYAAYLYNGSLLPQSDLIDELHEPTDSSVDGILDENYWNSNTTATLSLEEYTDRDRADAIIYRDEKGLRVAFVGYAKTITKKDILMFYISTYNTTYTIGSEYLDDYYNVTGQYAGDGDFLFHIELDRSLKVQRGLYKDWAHDIDDLSEISMQINGNPVNSSYIVEMFIPYTFLSTEKCTVNKDNVLGFAFRLAGENDRGSVVWNNYNYGGIYCDSESPASYVRIDGEGNIYAALDNSDDYRVDGIFNEALYSGKKATLSVADTTAEVYRTEKGVHVKYAFGNGAQSIGFTLSTVDHKLGAPYVYDYRIILNKDGTLAFSYGNSNGFYEPGIYVPYSAPRAVLSEENGVTVAELFISYDYLSRYNTTGNYTPKGYMQIDSTSALRFAFDITSAEGLVKDFVYNSANVSADANNPDTYLLLELK